MAAVVAGKRSIVKNLTRYEFGKKTFSSGHQEVERFYSRATFNKPIIGQHDYDFFFFYYYFYDQFN